MPRYAVNGFTKLMDSAPTAELMRNPRAFVLATQIAQRQRVTILAENNKNAWAQIGDHKNVGMSRQEYRTVKEFLTKNGIAKFRGIRGKGTLAKLMDNGIFDINCVAPNQLATISQPNANQIATNKESKSKSHTEGEDIIRHSPVDDLSDEGKGLLMWFDMYLSDEFKDLDTDTFRMTYERWIVHRDQTGSPVTQQAMQIDLETVRAKGVALAIENIPRAITGGFKKWDWDPKPKKTATRTPRKRLEGLR